jgi:hypothetical protein
MAKKKSAPRSAGKAVKKAPAPKKKSMPSKAKSAKPAKKANAPKKVAAKKAAIARAPSKKLVKGKPIAKKVATVKKAAPAKRVVVKKAAPAKKAGTQKVAPPKKATPTKNIAPAKAAPTTPKPTAKPEAPEPTAPVAEMAPPKSATPKATPAKKRPGKEKVVMEFYLNSTPTALYDQISTPSGFSEWYCQDVDVRGDQYTFSWEEGEVEETTLIGRKLGEVIRFRRNDEEDTEAYFEFRIRVDAMTNEVALVVTDFAWPHEVDETRNLWASQIHALMRVLGA